MGIIVGNINIYILMILISLRLSIFCFQLESIFYYSTTIITAITTAIKVAIKVTISGYKKHWINS